MKLINLLPYGLYFWLVNRATGWKTRPLVTGAPPVEILERDPQAV